MKLPKNSILIVLIFGLLVLSAVILAYVLIGKGSLPFNFLGRQKPTPAPQRELNSANFNTKQYVLPLENNSQGSIYSPRAQLRGTISEWGEKSVSVKVGEQVFQIALPENVNLSCMPLTFKNKDGTDVPSSTVYLDLRNAIQKSLVPVAEIKEKIPQGSDLTIQVKVDNNDKMTADFFIGYGCKI